MISKIDFNKIYYYYDHTGVGGVGFIKPMHPAGDRTALWNSPVYENLLLKHPKFKDEREIEPYSEDIKEYRNWLRDNGIKNWCCVTETLMECMYEIKDLETFPMAVKSRGEHLSIGPSRGKYKREWKLYLLLDE